MDLTQQEAMTNLNAVEQIQGKTRRALNAIGGDLFLILWGAIWIVGFLALHFFPKLGGLSWPILDLIGLAGTAGIIFYQYKHYPIQGKTWETIGRNIGLYWLFLILFGNLFLYFLFPGNSAHLTAEEYRRLTAYLCSLIMFGYVGMGLIIPCPLKENYLLFLGVVITLLVLAGFLAFPGMFYLWLSLTAGGLMFATGIYLSIRYRWS